MSFNKYNSANSHSSTFEARYAVNNHLSVPVLKATFFELGSKKKIGKYEIAHSHHSFIRSIQRGFKASDLFNVLEYGEQIEKQGMIFHVVNMRNLPQKLAKFCKDKMQEWVVITDSNQTQIITCYKAKGALKRIKRKVKSLIINV